jgi:hypothetical protein
MKHMLVALGVLGFVCAATAAVQAQEAKPGPEHKKLEYFVGDWTTEGEAKATPFSPAYKWSGTFSWEWLPGKFF